MAVSWPTVAWPNAEIVLLDWLRGQLPGVRLVTDLPADLESKTPVVQVVRIGGTSDGFRVDSARLDVDCFGASRFTAAQLAGQVRGLLPSLRGQEVGGAVVSRIVEEIAPSWRPDFNERVRRFGGTYLIDMRPA